MVPGVTVPYWDCSKDYYMDDPRESILWSEIFFGSGNGFVTDGPFGNWTNENEGPLFREIGVHPSSLFSVPGLKAIFARRSHTMITLPQPDLTQRFTIEGQQNGVHAWVGGQMRMREFSAQDPVHFLHRAFVDYIWNKFAENSEVDPGTDYPLKGGAEHSPNASMYYFEQNSNSDGYKLDALYDDTPFCNSTLMDCNSPWLECTYFLGNKVHMCISRRRAFFEIKDKPSTLDKVPTLHATPYNAVFVDERTGKTPWNLCKNNGGKHKLNFKMRQWKQDWNVMASDINIHFTILIYFIPQIYFCLLKNDITNCYFVFYKNKVSL